MNPGLPQGFVKFGTLAHRVLKLIHELGNLRHMDIADELPEFEEGHIAAVLQRLRAGKYIFKQDRALKYNTGERTQWIYGLQPSKSDHHYTRISTPAERTARYREKLRARKTSSIFSVGRTQINDR